MNTIGSPTDPTQPQNWVTGYVIPLVNVGKDLAVSLINAKNQNNANTNTNGNNSNGQVIYVPSNTTTTTEKTDNTMTYLLLAVAGIGLFATLNNDNKKRK